MKHSKILGSKRKLATSAKPKWNANIKIRGKKNQRHYLNNSMKKNTCRLILGQNRPSSVQNVKPLPLQPEQETKTHLLPSLNGPPVTWKLKLSVVWHNMEIRLLHQTSVQNSVHSFENSYDNTLFSQGKIHLHFQYFPFNITIALWWSYNGCGPVLCLTNKSKHFS